MAGRNKQPTEGMEVSVASMSDATFKYTWNIKKYSKLRTKKDFFDGAPFECNANGDRTQWNLSIRYWKGKNGKRLESPVVICLNLLETKIRNPGQATVSYEFGVFNRQASQWEACRPSRTVLNLPSSSDIISVGYHDLHISKEHLESSTGTLSIFVKLQVKFSDEPTLSNLQQDLQNLLLEANETGDVTFTCAPNKIIRAHKNILSVRSPVLRAMFRNGISTVDLESTSDDAVQKMLEYIYTDTTDLANSATVLISLAHRFHLTGLKTLCEKYLLENISASNVPSLLLVSEQFDCQNLKKALIGYCEGNAGAIQKNMTWKVLEMVNPELFEEVCEAGLGSSVSSNIDSLPSDPETP